MPALKNDGEKRRVYELIKLSWTNCCSFINCRYVYQIILVFHQTRLSLWVLYCPTSRSNANFSFRFIASFLWYSTEKLPGDLLFGLNFLKTISSPNALHIFFLGQVERIRSGYFGRQSVYVPLMKWNQFLRWTPTAVDKESSVDCQATDNVKYRISLCIVVKSAFCVQCCGAIHCASLWWVSAFCSPFFCLQFVSMDRKMERANLTVSNGADDLWHARLNCLDWSVA